jgi:DNA-binding transcriptional MerR regulator
MLKYAVDDVNALDESVQGLYEKTDDGKYVLQVEGVVPKSRLDEFRDNNIELKKQMDRFKNVDPDQYNELLDLKRKVDESKLVESGKVDEAVEQRVKTLQEEFDTKMQEMSGKYNGAQKELERTKLSSELQGKALQAGAYESALNDIENRARQVYRLVDNDIVPMDSKGQVIYGRNGSDPMPMNEWLKGLAKDAPHLFKGSEGGDAKNKGNAGQDRSKMSSRDKISSGLS